MPTLAWDIADPEVQRLFPAHGWALNSQGVKILWSPLRRLLVLPTRNPQGNNFLKSATFNPQDGLAFAETLRKLAVTLRELHRLVRLACDRPCNLEHETLEADHEAFEKVPLYVDLCFVYLRRVVDRLVVAARPFLFQHWESAPREFKNWVADTEGLRSLKPICDFDILNEAIADHSGWFKTLRSTSPATGKKGIRDALEHRATRFVVGKHQVGDHRPRFTVMIESRSRDVENRVDILPIIPTSVEQLCRLMAGIHSAIIQEGRYSWGDFEAILGSDDDIVGYWPRIGA